VLALASAIGPIETLRNDTLKPHVAGDAEQDLADVALLKLGDENAVDLVREQLGQRDLAHGERQPTEVLAVAGKHVERIELRALVVFTGVQRIEVGFALLVEYDDLAIEHEMLLGQLQCTRNDEREAIGSTNRPLVQCASQRALLHAGESGLASAAIAERKAHRASNK
jgi:hypothetical protein